MRKLARDRKKSKTVRRLRRSTRAKGVLDLRLKNYLLEPHVDL